jgi:hypothetical protein
MVSMGGTVEMMGFDWLSFATNMAGQLKEKL